MSTLKADTIQSTSGGAATLTKQSAAKAFVSFKGTSTVTVNDSQNISSVTDLDTGSYTPTFTNAMSNDTYSPAGGTFDSGETSSSNYLDLYTAGGSTMAAGSLQVSTRGHTDGVRVDPTQVNVTIHGDLA